MNVTFVASAINPCQWYRTFEPARAFPGARVLFGSPLHEYPLRRADEVAQLSYVHTERELEDIYNLRRWGAAIALDYDDDVLRMGADEKIVRAALEMSDLVTVSTPHLARSFSALAPGVPWAVVPNRVDTMQWVPGKFHPDAPVIGYAGSSAHTADFAVIAQDVWSVMRQRPTCRLRLLGCDAIAVPGDLAERVEQLPWQPVERHREAFAALEADIALAPLRLSEFNACRSELKWLQFSAMGVPLVATRLPPYSPIEDGVTGFTISPGLSWEPTLLRLLDDPRLRWRVGDAARNYVCLHYDLSRDRETRTVVYSQAINRARARERK